VVTPPVVVDDEKEQDSRNRGSDPQDSNSSVSHDGNAPVVTFGATGTTQPGDYISGLGATDTTVPGGDTDVATITDPDTATLVLDLPPAGDSNDPVPTLTAIDLNDGLLSEGGLSTNGPIAPPLPGVMLGSLDLMRRDLEQMSAPLTDDTSQDTGDTLIIDEPSNDSEPVMLTAAEAPAPPPPSWSVPDELTVTPTSAERTAAFQLDQAKRIAAFHEAQAARVTAFNEQQAEIAEANPVGALLNSAAFVVSELVNTAAVVVTEFVNYISLAITNFVQGISDWFTAPAVFEGMYGDPETNQRYYQVQSAQNCVMQSIAMVINQLKENAVPDPNEAAIALLASQTPSVDDPSKKMYPGLYQLDANGQQILDENGDPKTTQDALDIDDALKLLDMYGVDATLTKYDKTQGNLALRALALALQNNMAVTVGVQGDTLWNAADKVPLPGIRAADHQVVVIGVDFDNRIVHVNDSGLGQEDDGTFKGKNMKVPLDAFMRGWQTDNYETVVATLKQTAAPTPGVTSTNVSGSTVLVSVS